jgi:2-polyprenyl-3-methyl-5-hydroxy-6-metoxy-1,4-benzoquinol methylase
MTLERDKDNITFVWGMDFLGSDEGGRFLEQKYRPRIDALREYFGPRFAEIRLLDIGIGYGMFLKAAEEEGVKQVFGMDPFPKSIEIAKRNTSAEIFEGDILGDRWPVEKQGYDAVTCMDVLEHLEDPSFFFRRVKGCLREGGIVLVTTPNRALPYMMRSIPLVGFKDPNPTHINVRRPAYWRRLAIENGFEILKEWKGEYLTHIRFIPKVLMLLCRIFRIDHRKIPIVNSFEQSYCMVIKLRRALPKSALKREPAGKK